MKSWTLWPEINRAHQGETADRMSIWPLLFSQGCAEILAEAACAAGADYVHIGRYVAPTRGLSRAERERCMRAGTCHCIGNGTCFLDGEQKNKPWWWDFHDSPKTIDCESGRCQP